MKQTHTKKEQFYHFVSRGSPLKLYILCPDYTFSTTIKSLKNFSSNLSTIWYYIIQFNLLSTVTLGLKSKELNGFHSQRNRKLFLIVATG